MVSAHTDDEAIQVVAAQHPVKAQLPYVTCWPRGASSAFLQSVSEKYFSTNVFISGFRYSILLHKTGSCAEAIQTFTDAGAFSTHMGRTMLLHLIAEARNTEWCKKEVMDVLQRYATYAFVLDGSDVTCGVFAE